MSLSSTFVMIILIDAERYVSLLASVNIAVAVAVPVGIVVPEYKTISLSDCLNLYSSVLGFLPDFVISRCGPAYLKLVLMFFAWALVSSSSVVPLRN